jgi:predicted ATPase/class 3 adenylate cyclase/DNA-binding CsgD family transcriptional regulator
MRGSAAAGGGLSRPLLVDTVMGDLADRQFSAFMVPAGTITFLLTDIEGSTRLWEDRGDAMPAAIARHYEILDEAVSRHGGVRPVEQGEGDSVVAAFTRARDAVGAALDAQRRLLAEVWADDAPLRVRMAVHTGDAQLRDEGNYMGATVNRCARLREIAPGGQVLVSGATAELVADHLPEGADLVELGVHRLRDLGRPEHVFALTHPDLPESVGPLRSLNELSSNLPTQLTSFVGRRGELATLAELLGSTRLLTLTGAGGCGKTRLALQVAADALDRYPDGEWWVELAPLAQQALVETAVATAVGVRPRPDQTPLEAAIVHLSGRRGLLLLDNCEHLLEPCARLADPLLRSCPDVTVLATSREPLGVAGETVWRVPSLSLPADHVPETLPSLRQSDAVRLFIDRAVKVRPNFAVDNASAPHIAQICQELDGLPLAIELAAARVRMMSAEQIAAGLGDRFHLLTGGTRTALPRHQTLRACVDWSHALLSEQEQTLLRRLAVFAGGFTLDLAEAVCSGEALARVAVLDLLASLVDRSLVVTEEPGGAVRYRLLETVRQYALERLIDAGEAAAMRDRHRDAMLELAEAAAPELHRPSQGQWLDALDREAANFAAALDHAASTDPERGLRLCVALTFWWKGRGLFVPAERALAKALDAGNSEPSPLRAHAVWARGYLASYAGRYADAIASLHEAQVMAEAVGDQSALGRSLMALGFIQMFADPLGSRPSSERARDIARACGDDWALIASEINLACVHVIRAELDDAERLLDAVLPISERHGYLELQAWHWFFKSVRPWAAADVATASRYTTRSLKFARAAGEPTTEAFAQGVVAVLEVATGNAAAAEQRMRATYARALEVGGDFALGCTVTWLAQAQAALGDIAGARVALEEVVSTGMDLGFVLGTATVALADVLRVADEPAAAEVRAGEALAIAERIANPILIANAREILARLAAARGELGRAEALLHESLSMRIDSNLLLWLPPTFDALAEVAAGLESHEEAARLLGIAQRSRDDLGLVRWPPDDERFAQLEQTLRAALGDDPYEVAHAEGQELRTEEAVIWVRGARGARKRPASGWESLTPTELRVATLAAEGLTNPEIGERMFISRGTVKIHLSHVYAKLDVRNRSELAAHVARRNGGP